MTYNGNPQDMMPRLRMADFPVLPRHIPTVSHGPSSPRWSLCPEWRRQKEIARLMRDTDRRCGVLGWRGWFPPTGRARRIRP